MNATAKVYLVGAGPGDPDLLTCKAARLLASAEVVLYDRLVSAEILALAGPGAELVFVGKTEGNQHKIQDLIFDLLVRYAKAGKTVVRLKGGDPLVFGRGAEEWMLLREAGIDVELIPGISSSISAPALAGIPVTFRGVAHGFAVVTGHCMEGLIQDWSRYVAVDTLVVLMGSRQRVHIAQSLIDAGRDPEQPVAFIENGSTPNQRVIEADLGQVAAGLVEARNPSVFVIGEVVRLRSQLVTLVDEVAV